MASMLTKAQVLFKDIINTVLPIACVSCGTVGYYVCNYCLENLHEKKRIQNFLVEMRDLPVLSLQSIHTVLIREIIHLYKYDCVIQASDTIKQIVQKLYSELPPEIKKAFTENIIFVPIPLHTSRLKWRGYNQSRTIAEALSQCSGSPVVRLLNRSLKTQTQVGKSQKERHTNLQRAFTLNFDLARSLTGAKQIVLVDDVVTTGSTLIEAAAILQRRFPFSRLKAITLAQAPLHYRPKNDTIL